MVLGINLTCIPYTTISLFKGNFYNSLNIALGCILLVFGVIGNSLGIYVSLRSNNHPNLTIRKVYKKKFNTNQYLLTWFFSVNLINSILLILSPILKLHGASSSNVKWVSKGWITYWSDYNYPITKPIIAFGFFIYLIYFGTQALAIMYPFKYKTLVTKRRINAILIISLIYLILWHIPITHWFYTYKVFVCANGKFKVQNNIGFYIYAYDWVIRDAKPPFSTEILAWHCYQVLRELFVSILPFTSVIIVKVLIIKKRNRIAQASDSHVLSLGVSNIGQHSSYISETKGTGVDTTDIGTGTRTLPQSEIVRHHKHVLENKQHKKTMIVLTFEFVFLMLPVSVTQMFMDFLRSSYNRQGLATFYIFVTMLQFVYVSSTFFINYIFNSLYRQKVNETIMADLKLL